MIISWDIKLLDTIVAVVYIVSMNKGNAMETTDKKVYNITYNLGLHSIATRKGTSPHVKVCGTLDQARRFSGFYARQKHLTYQSVSISPIA